MTRMGLNCTMSYVRGGATRTYKVRAGDLSHGVEMISAESAARTKRAFYPHRSAEQEFSVQVLLKDWDERRHFVNWLASYATYALSPDLVLNPFPWMTVSVPSREFHFLGVPLQGYQWGAHTGMMMFSPQIIFEAATSPGGKTPGAILSTVINKWQAFNSDKAIQFFYPIGTQLSGNQVPNDYSKIVYPGDPSQFNPPPGPPAGPGPHPRA